MTKRPNKHEKGFTLIELAIVITIIGIMSSSLVVSLKYIEASSNIKETEDVLENEVSGGVMNFWATYGRYPCPADPTLSPDDANYGYEDCSGVVEVDGERGDLSDADTTTDKVYIGAVPFMTMLDPNHDGNTDDSIDVDIREKDTIDSWGYKIMYAVSANLTNESTFNQFEGVIDVVDENNISVLGSEKTAQFVLFSAGQNGEGAYTREGKLVSNCASVIVTPPDPDSDPNTGVAEAQIDESENCDNTDAVFLKGLRNETKDGYNDDLVYVGTILNAAHWIQTGGDEATGFLIANTNPRNVGIGVVAPQEHLHISGDLKADKIQASNFCNSNDYKDTGDPSDEVLCMPTKIIAGNEADMECSGAGMATTSIEKNKVNCKQVFPDNINDLTNKTCPSGYAVCGISNKTGVLCRSITSGGDCKSP